MAPKTPTTTTQISKVELPKWVDEAAQRNYKFAEEIAGRPYVPYDGKTVADTSATTQQAYDYFKNTMDVGKPSYDIAAGLFDKIAGGSDYTRQSADLFTKATQGNANLTKASDLFTQAGKGILGLNRDDYMNPFIDNVESKALGALDKQRVQALMGNSDAAAAAGAFGGSRHGVVDAITNAETAEKAGLLSADLRRQAYDSASALMQGDINNMMGAGSGLAGLGQNEIANLIASGQGLAGLGQQEVAGWTTAADGRMKLGDTLFNTRQNNFSGLLGIGQQEQLQEQRKLDDAKSRWDEEQNHDIEQLNVLLSSLGMSPYGKTENTTKTTSGGGGTDFAQMGLGILSLLMGLPFMSDRTMKTDIKKEGEKNGVPIYSYRYKGDPKTYPKVVGPMAQDIEKARPGSTGRTSDGKMTVPLGVLAEYM